MSSDPEDPVLDPGQPGRNREVGGAGKGESKNGQKEGKKG